jgi:hypothetical protein
MRSPNNAIAPDVAKPLLEEIAARQVVIDRLTVEYEAVIAERDSLILDALDLGTPVAVMARTMGVTTSRIYQLKAGGRGAVDGHLNGRPARIALDDQGKPAAAFGIDETGENVEELL